MAAGDGLDTCMSATHMGDPELLVPWVQPVSAMAAAGIWGGNQWIEDLSGPLHLCFCLSNKMKTQIIQIAFPKEYTSVLSKFISIKLYL